MKTTHVLLIIFLTFGGCISENNDDFGKNDKIKQVINPIHITKGCDPHKEIIGAYEFEMDNTVTDSVQILIKSGSEILDEFTLNLKEHSTLKNKNFIVHGAHSILPISFEIPSYNGDDTLDLTIVLNRPNRKMVTNTCTIIYNQKRDTIDFISYDIPTKIMKFAFQKKFDNSHNILKRNYGYKINYESIQRVRRTADSTNFSIQLKNTVIIDPETGKEMKFNETPEVSYNYPLHYDILESEIPYNNNRGPFKVLHNTLDSVDSYAGYNFYFKRLGTNIKAVIKDCRQIDTLYSKDIFIPGMLRPNFYSEKVK